MLVLSRMVGQKIVIGAPGESIEIEIVAVRGSKVRLGVTAPTAIPVFREEIAPDPMPQVTKLAKGNNGNKIH